MNTLARTKRLKRARRKYSL